MMGLRWSEDFVLRHNTNKVKFEFRCDYIDINKQIEFSKFFNRTDFLTGVRELIQVGRCIVPAQDESSKLYINQGYQKLDIMLTTSDFNYINLSTRWKPMQLLSGNMLTERNNNYEVKNDILDRQ